MACTDVKQLVNIDLGGTAKVKNAPTPMDGGDLVNKDYVDAAMSGNSAWKEGVDCASLVSVNIASPTASIDGFTLVNGSRVLLKDQATTAENGIYVFNGTALVRAQDADTDFELDSAIVTVEHGTQNGGVTFRQTHPDVHIGTDDNAWVQYGQSSPAATETVAGIAEIASQAEVDAGTDNTRIVTPKALHDHLGGAQLHKNATVIGDGTNSSFNVNHNLNTEDVQVQVFEAAGAKSRVITGIEIVDVNTVKVCFNTPPASNEYKVVTIG